MDEYQSSTVKRWSDIIYVVAVLSLHEDETAGQGFRSRCPEIDPIGGANQPFIVSFTLNLITIELAS